MAQIIKVPSLEEFDAAFDEAKKDPFFVAIFVGGPHPDNSEISWCDDCDNAKPNLENILLKNTTLKVLWVIVQTKDEWKGVADHKYKVHEDLKLNGIPTALLFNDGAQVMRAESEADFKNEELLMAMAKPE